MPEQRTLLEELERTIAGGTPEGRHAALTFATDLLIAGRYSDDEVWVFGEVVGLLAAEIEASARAQLAQRLAQTPKAPANILSRLASDDAIDVAAPVLRHSEALPLHALVENAKTKSQDHLMAISQRKSLPENVTDVLVARGNREVVRSVSRNNGARFSESGFWRLVQRCEDDVVLAAEVGARKDIPRHHFQKLVAKASDEVRARLVASNPGAAVDVNDAVMNVAGSIQAKFGPGTRTYFTAKRQVADMQRAGTLDEAAVATFARERKIEELTVALSLICEVPVDVVERALIDDGGEMALIFAKIARLSRETVRLLLSACRGGISPADLESALRSYGLLSVQTARQVLNFYRSRQAAGASAAVH